MVEQRLASPYDCIVVGGGPAGLSAALMLGRARRRVLLCDAGAPRNISSREVHGFLTRDGTPPAAFLGMARDELGRYDGVEVRDVQVMDACRLSQTPDAVGDGFEVTLASGGSCRGRRLLLATGVVDDIPPIEGISELYGRSVHHCPYCDGWEHRDQPIAVYGFGKPAMKFALGLTRWSHDLVLCTDGGCGLEAGERERLARHGIILTEERIVRLEGLDGQLERIVLASGEALARQALFFTTGQRQRSGLAAKLGCRFNSKGAVETRDAESTNVPGLYVAGDASRDAQLVVVAAAEGAAAALAIDGELMQEELAAGPAATP